MILKPLHDNRVNKKVARMNAGWVVAFGLVFIVLPDFRWIIFLMLINFFIKGFVGPWYSPISQINKFLLDVFKIKPQMIFAPPKIFAAKIGFIFTLIGSILYLSGFLFASQITIALLLIFASLELFLEFCMGCYMHSVLYRER